MSKNLSVQIERKLIIENLSFELVKSQLGKGTEIAVYFPVSTDLEEPPHAVDEAELLCGHGELVLVIDDEESIRQITKSTLETFGYRVLTASDGTEALAQYATNRSVAVVLMDLVMPFMDGVATIRALRRLDPALKIICTSGLSDDTRAVTITRAEANAFLTKPYTAKQLLKALAQVL